MTAYKTTPMPTENLHDYDIMDTVGVSSWTDMFSEDANINPDSKHKPVVNDIVFCQDFSSSKPNYVAGWWKANDGLCGYNISNAKATSWTALKNKFDGGKNGWKYVPPYGTEKPLRQNDFAGYYHAASPIASGFYAPSSVTTDDTSANCQIVLSSKNNNSLSWADFDTLGSYYFGVMIYFSDSSYMCVTSTTKLKDGGGTVTFDPSKLTNGRTYTVYPFISQNTIAFGDSASPNNVYAMPNTDPAEMKVKATSISILITAQRGSAARTVVWSVSATSDTDITLTNNSVWIHKYGQAQSSSGDANINMSDKTLSAGVSTLIGSGTATMGYDIDNVVLVIEVSLGKGKYTKSEQVAGGTPSPINE